MPENAEFAVAAAAGLPARAGARGAAERSPAAAATARRRSPEPSPAAWLKVGGGCRARGWRCRTA